jgi:hypothetical protein
MARAHITCAAERSGATDDSQLAPARLPRGAAGRDLRDAGRSRRDAGFAPARLQFLRPSHLRRPLRGAEARAPDPRPRFEESRP